MVEGSISFNWVAEQSDKVEWVKKARWVDEGDVITSSGISAGIDMSLYVVSRLFGETVRDEIAKRAEYTFCIDPLSDPFSI